MERISRGNIWTVELISHPKPRPALIVSINAVNDLRSDVLVLPITSQPGPLRVQLPDNPEQTGLRATSYVKCESLGPLHKSRLKLRIESFRRRPGRMLKQAFDECWVCMIKEPPLQDGLVHACAAKPDRSDRTRLPWAIRSEPSLGIDRDRMRHCSGWVTLPDRMMRE